MSIVRLMFIVFKLVYAMNIIFLNTSNKNSLKINLFIASIYASHRPSLYLKLRLLSLSYTLVHSIERADNSGQDVF